MINCRHRDDVTTHMRSINVSVSLGLRLTDGACWTRVRCTVAKIEKSTVGSYTCTSGVNTRTHTDAQTHRHTHCIIQMVDDILACLSRHPGDPEVPATASANWEFQPQVFVRAFVRSFPYVGPVCVSRVLRFPQASDRTNEHKSNYRCLWRTERSLHCTALWHMDTLRFAIGEHWLVVVRTTPREHRWVFAHSMTSTKTNVKLLIYKYGTDSNFKHLCFTRQSRAC